MNLTEAKNIVTALKEEIDAKMEMMRMNVKDAKERHSKAKAALGEDHPEVKKLKAEHEAHAKAYVDHVNGVSDNEMKDAEHARQMDILNMKQQDKMVDANVYATKKNADAAMKHGPAAPAVDPQQGTVASNGPKKGLGKV